MLSQDRAAAIDQAAATVAANDHDAEFPIDVFQTGSGTSSNMNANEVIGTLASEILGETVHPNDHVNASQSSNDVFPSAIHIAATQSLINTLIPALQHLEESLEGKAIEFAEVVKSGRTHLMDATPVTLGQEFGGYAAQIHYGIERIESTLPRVAELPLGGTAVGTGINTPPGFAASVISIIAEKTGLPLSEARNHFEAQGARDALVEAVRRAADHRGQPEQDRQRPPLDGFRPAGRPRRDQPARPAAGIVDHARQGQPRALRGDHDGLRAGDRQRRGRGLRRRVGQLRAERDAAGDGAEPAGVDPPAGQRQPVARRPVRDGIEANVEHCRILAESSPSIVTPLNRYIGYENAAAVAKQALKDGKTIRDVVLEKGFVTDGSVTEDQLDAALDVLSMTRAPA